MLSIWDLKSDKTLGGSPLAKYFASKEWIFGVHIFKVVGFGCSSSIVGEDITSFSSNSYNEGLLISSSSSLSILTSSSILLSSSFSGTIN